MTDKEKVSYYLANVDKSFWKKVRIVAYDENKSVKQLIIDAIQEYIKGRDIVE